VGNKIKINIHTNNAIIYFLLTLIIIFEASCSTIKAGIYLSSIDPKEFEMTILKEPDVKILLEEVYKFSENYTMSAYTRTAIKSNIKKSERYTHAYYVIHNNTGQFYTLSFNGTQFSRYSNGVWAVNTESDLNSYISFLDGENIWSVEIMKSENIINVKETIFNILGKIDSHITYYYIDHLNKKVNMENCITALTETLVEKQIE
jgi:hypothetical protein